MEKILLGKNKSKRGVTENNSVTLHLLNSERTLPVQDINGVIDQYKLYNDERDDCNNYRLFLTINPICSNVLFNILTEVIDNGDKRKYAPCNMEIKNRQDYIRDTECSHPLLGNLEYRCGIDIFNNHMLRTKEFTVVNKINTNRKTEDGEDKEKDKKVFNTINDYLRDSNGNIIKDFDYSIKNITYTDGKIVIPKKKDIRLYRMNEIMSFEETINEKLVEKDGWLGFINPQTTEIINYKDDVSINKCINNRNGCDFIDLYPDRTLFSFHPKINKKDGNRHIKNWECVLTYPYKKYEGTVDFITDNKSISLDKEKVKIFVRNNEKIVIFKSPIKHNLENNSSIRLYINNNESFVINIYEIGDINSKNLDFCFSVKYKDITNIQNIFNDSDIILENVKLSFKKIENGVDCEYYFREHRIIPNLKFGDESINYISEENIDEYIKNINKKGYFDYKINNLSFAKNIYSDNMIELIYTDDVNISRLKNTMGMPLNEIYLTIIKTNESKETNKGEEYISPFGKLTAGMDLNIEEDDYNIHKIHNISNKKIQDSLGIKPSPKALIGNNISINDESFIGDLVEYSPSNCKETVLENVYYRFNTTQRESELPDGNLYYDELIEKIQVNTVEKIIPGELEAGNIYYALNNDAENEYPRGFHKAKNDSKDTVFLGDDIVAIEQIYNGNNYPANISPEGYYYKAHYPIKINAIDKNLSHNIDRLIIYKDISKKTENSIEFTVNDVYFLEYGDSVYLENKTNNFIDGYITKVNKKESKIIVEFNKSIIDLNVENYKLFKYNYLIPSYAYKYKDLSGRYVWREVLPKSNVRDDNEISNMVFANNALYVEEHINFYLKRQDPNGDYGLRFTKDNVRKKHRLYNFSIDGKMKDTTKYEYTSDIKWRIC